MKFLFISAMLVFLSLTVHGQVAKDIIKQQAVEGVKEGSKNVTEATGEKVTDKLLNKLFNKKKKKRQDDATNNNSSGKSKSVNSTDTSGNTMQTGGGGPATSFQAYSKFDFVPGDKIIAFEDFSQDAIGDFPDKWNTNSSGEVVTLNKGTTHWLSLNKQGRFIPEFINSLPDNFTLQFDLQNNPNFNDYSSYFKVWMLSGGQTKGELAGSFLGDEKRSGAAIEFEPDNRWNHSGRGKIFTYQDGAMVINGNSNEINFLKNLDKSNVKVSIWRQNQRIRVYMDNEKVFDLPRAFESGKNYNFLMFELPWDMKGNDAYYFSNISLAVGAPDTRNKLISEGKFSTTGILFDVNSAKIKPESYGTLKDIADVLKDNSSVHVTIIGHTDSDGKPDYNLKLSKERADAVKDALSSQFGIDASRMSTDGKGATQPVGDNKTPEGKAQNRRVEFVKQ